MKKIKMLCVLLLTGAILGGCSSAKISDVYDEQELKKSSQEIINMICNDEYNKVVEEMSDEMKAGISEQQLSETLQPVIEKLGKFKGIEKEGVMDSDGLATVVTIAEFENGKAQFSITYNEDMKLEGLYMK